MVVVGRTFCEIAKFARTGNDFVLMHVRAKFVHRFLKVSLVTSMYGSLYLRMVLDLLPFESKLSIY